MIDDAGERFVWTGDGNAPEVSQCVSCRFKHKDGPFCDAFPDGEGIPEVILLNNFAHDKPFEGDHGIMYEPERRGRNA